MEKKINGKKRKKIKGKKEKNNAGKKKKNLEKILKNVMGLPLPI